MVIKIIGKNSDEQELIDKVYNSGQEHVFRFWEELTDSQKENLISQLKQIDFNLVDELSHTHLKSNSEDSERPLFEAPETIDIPKTEKDLAYMKTALHTGKRYLEEGKVSVFIVAGGQGSRLGFEGPKGCYKISPIKKKSIFQLHCEKISALEKKYSQTFPLYIMTSDTNHSETKEFFENNDYFGLNEVHFFKQGMLPAVDEKGKLILSKKHEIFMNPDGHGGSIYALKRSGAIEDMKKKGIEMLYYIQVDNILVNMLDPVFIGYHVIEKAEMSSKAVSKISPEEKVGVIGVKDGKNTVIEYSVLPDTLRYERNSNGKLKFDAGNIAIHCLNIDFIEKVYHKKLPHNKAFKAIPYIDESGTLITPETPNAYKFEMFVFDALSMANKTITMMVERNSEFAPVKNKDGTDSPNSAKKMLSDFYKGWLNKINVEFDEHSIVEISPLYALDEDELAIKLKSDGKDISDLDEVYLGN